MAEDATVGVVVKIIGSQDEGDFVADFGQEEQAAEYGPLGFNALRRLSFQELAEPLARCDARFSVYRGHVRRSFAMGMGPGGEVRSEVRGAANRASQATRLTRVRWQRLSCFGLN
jgi:hypothetical protein